MAIPREDIEWKNRWEERGVAIRRMLGDTEPPGTVLPFSWEQYKLPGACALTFKPTATRNDYLSMTLGMTQPLRSKDRAYPWEFAVRVDEPAEWPADLLYQLVTQWLYENGDIGLGYRLPLVFFKDPAGKLWAGLTDDTSGLSLASSIRAMYLWTDETGLRFHVSTGEFGLLTVVAVTEDEDCLAQETTPPHLLLLLKRLGVTQVCDPYRRSALTKSNAISEWSMIKTLPHDDAYEQLQGIL
jgi:hypothetical protein